VSALYDVDGIDGPFERAMNREIAREVARANVRAAGAAFVGTYRESKARAVAACPFKVGDRVRVLRGDVRGRSIAGRLGTVRRICAFAMEGHVDVELELQGRERTAKRVFARHEECERAS
jgi:hypothetical protein